MFNSYGSRVINMGHGRSRGFWVVVVRAWLIASTVIEPIACMTGDYIWLANSNEPWIMMCVRLSNWSQYSLMGIRHLIYIHMYI